MMTAARFKMLYFTIYGLSILYLYLTPLLALAKLSQLALLVLSRLQGDDLYHGHRAVVVVYRLEWLCYGDLSALASLLVIKITLLPVAGYWLLGLVSCYAVLYILRRTVYFRQSRQNDQPAAAAQPAGSAPAAGHADTSAEDAQLIYVARWVKVIFKDVVGMADVKARLRTAGDEILSAMHPAHCQEVHAEPRNGILLYGTPGNGKTFSPRHLSGNSNCLSEVFHSVTWSADGPTRSRSRCAKFSMKPLCRRLARCSSMRLTASWSTGPLWAGVTVKPCVRPMASSPRLSLCATAV